MDEQNNTGSAAHLTGTVTSCPSIFEVISAQRFSSALHSALRHLAQYFASRNPESYGFIARNYDELYLLVDTALQFQYFKTKRATLGETFYGLQRFPNDNNQKLSVWASLIAVTLLPYIQRKISARYHAVKEQDTHSSKEKLLLRTYPAVTAAISAVKLYKYVKYALGISASHDYVFDLLGIHLGHSDIDQAPKDVSAKPLKRFLTAAADSILWAIEIGSFFVQFLETYNKKHRSGTSHLRIPPFYKGPIQLDDTKCPLCQDVRKNPAALATSGYSFCYSCIAKYLTQNKNCPVTNIPANSSHIIRIFYS